MSELSSEGKDLDSSLGITIDVSPKMVRLAQQRVGSRARVFHADLSQPLDFAEGETCRC
jgi:hypothetical protein